MEPLKKVVNLYARSKSQSVENDITVLNSDICIILPLQNTHQITNSPAGSKDVRIQSLLP